MRRIQISKMVFWCFILLTVGAAKGQVNPSDGHLILYEVKQMQGKYVLCVNFDSPEKGKSSLVVIGDTFEVQPRGAMCWVVMTNAYILQTGFDRSTNAVQQIQMRFDVYKLPFSKDTKLVFNNSIVELPNVKIGVSDNAKIKSYEGEDALRQMKKMGLNPPDDMDTQKANGK